MDKQSKLNKRGDILMNVMFITLNLLFFLTMALFVHRAASSAFVYEEAYAKKIALILNRAESGMEIELDISDLVNVALKNKIDPTKIQEIIKIDSDNGTIMVKAKPEGGFVYPYYSDLEFNENRISLVIPIPEKPKEISESKYLINIK